MPEAKPLEKTMKAEEIALKAVEELLWREASPELKSTFNSAALVRALEVSRV